MKKLNSIFNIVIVSVIVVFIGHAVCIIYSFKIQPEVYAMQSAPWYTSILVEAILTIVVVLICIIIKLIIKYLLKNVN